MTHYVCNFSIKEDVKSFAAASHLWHLSHIFRTLEFEINGINKIFFRTKDSYRSALRTQSDNLFLITICDSDEKRILKHIELVKFILYDRYPNIQTDFKTFVLNHEI